MAALELRRSSSYPNGETGIQFDNSGEYPLLVPGFGYPVPIERPSGERFAHGFGDWAQNRLTAREIVMLRLMNDVTDQLMWYVAIHDAFFVADWTEEALSRDMISPAAWDWCLLELRDKADLYEASSLTLVLDSAARVCKSDDLISPELLKKLASEVESLDVQEGGHPVDPDMFPLVYGQTRVLADGGCVDVSNAVDCAGKGTPSGSQIWRCSRNQRVRCDGSPRMAGWSMRGRGRGGAFACARCGRADRGSEDSSWEPRGHRFSSKYQWLPSEISFAAGSEGVKISSYINNLHPQKHSSLYETIERCIDAAIPAWNEVLVRRDKGRIPERIQTYGPQWTPDPSDGSMLSIVAAQQLPWLRAKWVHPEPGSSFSYQDWKNGRNILPIVPGKLPPKEIHGFYFVDLARDYATEGLQVIIEIGSVELTPELPTKPATDWTLSGLPNEHIVATSIVHFASENITTAFGSISYRVEADLDPDTYIWGGRDTSVYPYHPLDPIAGMYGLLHQDIQYDYCDDSDRPIPALQHLGDIETPDGRLIVFPNVMQHRTNSYNLLNTSRPGRRRFLKLHLVDAHYRICSTRNVPPQRHDWWYNAGLGRIDWESYDMPAELVLEIERLVGDPYINMEDARRFQEEFRAERKEKYEVLNKEGVERYRFALCEMDA